MIPIEFLVFDGDSEPNMETYKVSEAMTRHIRIQGEHHTFSVVGYYYCEEDRCMVLDIIPDPQQ